MLKGFVSVEGIDGSGKSTVCRRVAGLLKESGEHVFLTGEPTSNWTGEAVRRSYADDVGPLAEAFLFLADRAVHQEELRDHLAKGELVLSDRYADSTYAYQGARLERVVPQPIEFLRRASEPWLLIPDLTILLRVPADVGLARISGRADKVKFEERALLTKVAANYDKLAKSPRFATVDATGPVEDVVNGALAAIRRRLRKGRSR